MEKYYNDKKFREDYTKIVHHCNISRMPTTHMFYDYDPNRSEYKKHMNDFIEKYKDVLGDDDFLMAMCKPLEKREYPKPINILLDLFEHYNNTDSNRVKIIKYIHKVYPEQIIKEYKDEICEGLKSIISPELWLESIELFSDEKYEWFHEEFRKDIYDHKEFYLYNRYFEMCRENKEYEQEIRELKERLEELELQIKYMPGGEGYYEAKENFDKLKN
jgi:hypothetical protein